MDLCLYDTTNHLDEQVIQLQRARAVLTEISGYFEYTIKPGTLEAHQLALRSENIHLLLSVLDDILYRTAPQLEAISNSFANTKSP